MISPFFLISLDRKKELFLYILFKGSHKSEKSWSIKVPSNYREAHRESDAVPQGTLDRFDLIIFNPPV